MRQLFEDLDKKLAFLGLLFSIILTIYLTVSVGRIVYVLTGVLTLISCTIWLLMREKASLKFDIYQSNSIILVLFSIFFFLFAFSILLIQFRMNLYERPLIYFVLTSLMTGLVAVEILFTSTKKHTGVILFQMVIIGLSLVWTEQLIFPSVIGIDPGWHRMFTLKILESGYIPDGYAYSKLPLMHLGIGITSLITTFNYKISGMFFVGFTHVLSSMLFIFLIGKFLHSEKVGLLGGLLLSTANYHIQYGWWSVPNTIAAVMMLIIMYLLFKIKVNKHFISVSLALFLMLSLILTHTVTSMCMAIILFVSWMVSELYSRVYGMSKKTPVTLTIAVLFSVLMFSWWIYASGHIRILSELIKWGFSIDVFYHGPRILDYYITTPFIEQLFNYLGFILFLALSIIGCFYVISKKGHIQTSLIAFSGMTILAIGYFSLITGKEVLNVRWWYFSQILLVLPLAIALFLLLNTIKRRGIKPVLLLTLTILLSFIMIMSPSANIDNHLFSPNTGVRFGFTEAEMIAASFFAQNSVGTISSDFDYCTNPSSSVFCNYYNVSYNRILSLDESLYKRSFVHDKSIKIVRREIVDRPFRLAGGLYRLPYDPNVILSASGFNKIYDSSAVTAYL